MPDSGTPVRQLRSALTAALRRLAVRARSVAVPPDPATAEPPAPRSPADPAPPPNFVSSANSVSSASSGPAADSVPPVGSGQAVGAGAGDDVSTVAAGDQPDGAGTVPAQPAGSGPMVPPPSGSAYDSALPIGEPTDPDGAADPVVVLPTQRTVPAAPPSAPTGQDDAVSRLVLVATSAWRIPEIEQLWRSGSDRLDPAALPVEPPPAPDGWPDTEHGRLLRALLSGAADTGRAWICQDPAGAADAPEHQPWDAGGEQLARTIAARVHAACHQAADPKLADRADANLRAQRHRVLLDAPRVAALLAAAALAARGEDWPDDRADRAAAVAATVRDALDAGYTGHFVAVDLRFQFLLERPLCLASITVWSGLPWGGHFAPVDLPRGQDEAGVDVDRLGELFSALREGLELLVGRYLTMASFRVYRQAYRMPMFWIAVPAKGNGTRELAAGYLDPEPTPLLRRLSAGLLAAQPRDSVVARSVVGGEHLVLRRVRDDNAHSVAHYLIVPGRAVAPARSDTEPADRSAPESAKRGLAAAARQELTSARMIEALTELEALCGTELYHVQSDLETWSSNLTMYRAVAERGAFLWDGLSTHLPVRRWRRLNQAHRAVELLHQMLLQSVADLGHLAAQIGDCRDRVSASAQVVTDTFDARLTETPWRDEIGLREATVRTGLFQRVVQGAEREEAAIRRVQARYDELQAAITSAFDERRVRESDLMQKGNFTIAVALVAAGVVTVEQATVRLIPASGDITEFGNLLGARTLTALSWGAAGVMLVSGGWVLWQIWRNSRLGSSDFRKLYNGPRWITRLLLRPVRRLLAKLRPKPTAACFVPTIDAGSTGAAASVGAVPVRERWYQSVDGALRPGLWRFLQEAATDGLEGQRRRARDLPEAQWRARWRALDDDLAARFVELWDRACPEHELARADAIGADIKALGRQIEQWGVQALLLTERARRLHRYPLPKLTCLYRACNRLARRGFLEIVDPQRRLTVVPDKDFVRCLQQLGFLNREAALWLDRRVLTVPTTATAAQLLGNINRIGLDAQLRPDDCDPVLDQAAACFPDSDDPDNSVPTATGKPRRRSRAASVPPDGAQDPPTLAGR